MDLVEQNRVLVTGGRDFKNYARVKEKLLETQPNVIIQGGSTGADYLTPDRDWETILLY